MPSDRDGRGGTHDPPATCETDGCHREPVSLVEWNIAAGDGNVECAEYVCKPCERKFVRGLGATGLTETVVTEGINDGE